jgi:hypothetical protein
LLQAHVQAQFGRRSDRAQPLNAFEYNPTHLV